MSYKRRVVSAWGKEDQLLEIGRGLELDLMTRMSMEELRDALVARLLERRKASLATVFGIAHSRPVIRKVASILDHDKETRPYLTSLPEGGRRLVYQDARATRRAFGRLVKNSRSQQTAPHSLTGGVSMLCWAGDLTGMWTATCR